MTGHLATARGGIVGGADRFEQHLVGRHTELQAERAVPVIGVKPVVTRLEGEPGGDVDRLVARAADLKEDAVLPLELDLAVIQSARQVDDAVDVDELFGGQAAVFLLGRLSCG